MAKIAGEWQTATIADGQSKTSEIDLGGSYDFVQVLIPSTITACNMSLEAALETAGTFYRLGSSDNVAAVDAAAHMQVFLLGKFRYIKVVASVAQASGDTILVRGIN